MAVPTPWRQAPFNLVKRAASPLAAASKLRAWAIGDSALGSVDVPGAGLGRGKKLAAEAGPALRWLVGSGGELQPAHLKKPPMKTNSPVSDGPATPANADELFRAAMLHAQRGQPLEAAKLFLEVTRLRPDGFEAYCQLGLMLRQLGQLDDALSCLHRAREIKPGFPKLNLLIGSFYKQQGRLAEAADCCRREIQLDPTNADAHYNLGLVLQNLDQPEEAIRAYRAALAVRPDYVDALVNLGELHQGRLDLDAAVRFCEEAIRLRPDSAEAHWQLGTALLARGDFVRGWREYEWRWKLPDFATPQAGQGRPLWDGADLHGQRILLHAEQGFGDFIQFIRYAPLVARRGGEVIVGCPPPLLSLLATVPGVKQVVTDRTALPPFAVQAPVLSLPAIFRTTLANLPREVPYLSAPASGLVLPETAGARLQVGLVWAGAASHKNDRRRSLPLELLRDWAELPGIQWHSLQVGPRAVDLASLGIAGKFTDWNGRLRDFGDTASMIAQLDLVIAVDTAVAHLAGALSKPVWTLLPFAAEWRWMQGREDSPWYPTMRLFRQSSPGDWPELLGRVKTALGRLLEGSAASAVPTA